MTRWLDAGAGDDADGGPSTGAAAARGAADGGDGPGDVGLGGDGPGDVGLGAGRPGDVGPEGPDADGRLVDGGVADGRVADGRVADGRVADGRFPGDHDAGGEAASRRPARAGGVRGRVTRTRNRVVATVSRLATRWTAALLVVVATILAGVFATPLGSAPGVVALLAVLIMVLAMLATSRSYGPVGPRYGPGLRRVAAAPPVVIAQIDPDTAARPRPRAPTAQLVPLSCPSRCSRSEGSRHALRSRPACPGHSRARPRPLLRCGAARR